MTDPVGLHVDSLRRYLRAAIPDAPEVDSAELLSGGRSNLTYALTAGDQRWVLRRPPLGGLTPSAHDMSREYRVVEALQDSGVPVARTIVLCEDSSVIGVPFAVASFVEGTVIRSESDLKTLSDIDIQAVSDALMGTLATLHAVPYERVGLGEFGRPEGYLGRQVRRWRDQWQRVATRELNDIETLHTKLADRVPRESGASIVHGDFRIDNAILGDPGDIRAVVDWEMATLGDPLADLGLALVYRDTAFAHVLADAAASTSARMPSADAQAQRYAQVSGRDLSNLDFYLALGYFKIAVIAEGIHARYVAGQTVGDGYERVGGAVAELAAAGLRVLS
ncbi:phosphotransferase family protein [Hoyosella altamirensis]|uniref:Aminoglycoside phosphotransferase (APT) family kinase protein n=1 Tax=Hoyosella altamirensis TaxID=616997 RepID=A0A839RT93_9ACTN|nr:phosphotransferase family protein [Hoyosella altamirensis]MBB3039438.1 aminoglycoside phosphotransferase (APT) family kinase protein [Hoyosella altamirensis]